MYKIGDRVRAKIDCEDISIGYIGTILEVGEKIYLVKFVPNSIYMTDTEFELAAAAEQFDRQHIQKESVLIDLPSPHKQTIDEYLTEITNELTGLKEQYITDDVVHHELYTRHYGYDGAYEIHLITYRLETDEEYFERINEEYRQAEKAERKRLEKLEKNKAKREAKEAAERAEYERLKAKFGVEE